MRALDHLSLEFAEAHPTSVAKVLESLEPQLVAPWFSSLPDAVGGRLFEKLIPSLASYVIQNIPEDRAVAILSRSAQPNVVGALRQCSESKRATLVDRLPKALATRVGSLLAFSENTAAGFADSSVFALADDLTVGEALELCRKNPREAHHYLYVLDRDQVLRGVISLMELLQRPPEASLENEMNKEVLSLRASLNRQEVLRHSGWRQFHALPVVDDKDRFLGSIRYETVRLLEAQDGDRHGGRAAREAVQAFGSLYGVALMGLAQGAGSVFQGSKGSKK